jgi:hypothetical protein
MNGTAERNRVAVARTAGPVFVRVSNDARRK